LNVAVGAAALMCRRYFGAEAARRGAMGLDANPADGCWQVLLCTIALMPFASAAVLADEPKVSVRF